MPGEIIELYNSREGNEGVENPSATLRYLIRKEPDDVAARTLIESTIPSTYLGLDFNGYTVTPLGAGIWDVTANYGVLPPDDSTVWDFDSSGNTAHITQSLQTVARYPVATAPNFYGAIGVSGDGVEGVDITIPKFDFGARKSLPKSSLTTTYMQYLIEYTGTVNNAAWTISPFAATINFAAGEVLYLGATISTKSATQAEVALKFSAIRNQTGLSVGSITGIAKKGWEHLWVRYIDDVDSNSLIKRPVAAYVERVYRTSTFTNLGVGS